MNDRMNGQNGHMRVEVQPLLVVKPGSAGGVEFTSPMPPKLLLRLLLSLAEDVREMALRQAITAPEEAPRVVVPPMGIKLT